MSKGRKKKPSAKGKMGSKKSPGARPKGRRGAAMVIPKAVTLAVDYRRLLFDPCAANMVHPPYMGMDSGYLIRTRDVVVPFVYNLTAGGITYGSTNDFIVQWSPGNLGPSSTTTNYGLLVGGAPPGTAVGVAPGSSSFGQRAFTVAQSNFINQTGTSVNTYRVVACCMRFIPTGPALTRQGAVMLINTPSPQYTTGVGALVSDIEQMCPFPQNNGMEATKHEIVWLPNNKDQEFGILEASVLEPGYGTLTLGLGAVDSTNFTSGLYNGAVANGRVEITTVWQWVAKGSNGLTQTLTTPTKHNVNDVLSGVSDIGKAIYTGLAGVEHEGVQAARFLIKHLL